MMKICLVAAFPPSIRPLNEYSFHIARELQRHPDVELTILADELEEGDSAPGMQGDPAGAGRSSDLPGVTVIRCWKFGSVATPIRLLKTIRQLKPDVVWFNLVFSSFGPPGNPFAAFAGLFVPALTRAAGYHTHITLHHIVEHVDFVGAGVRRERFYRMGADVATRALLRAHGVSVLLSAYRRTLMSKYSAQNVLVGTHGIFATIPSPPDLTKRGKPDLRILAFGHWGTYKRLERLMEAFPAILEKVPNARLIVAGGNHPGAPGYWESIRDAQPAGLPIEFLGYIPQNDVPELFRSSSLLVMPYDSSTGSSGPAHQACEFGLPIVCADIADFRCMAADDDMAINFYKIDDAADLTEKLLLVLQSPKLQRQMSLRNYEAGVQMTMATVANTYLRWFELHRFKRAIERAGKVHRVRQRWTPSWSALVENLPVGWKGSADGLPVGDTASDALETSRMEILSSALPKSAPLRQPPSGTEQMEGDWYDATQELGKAG